MRVDAHWPVLPLVSTRSTLVLAYCVVAGVYAPGRFQFGVAGWPIYMQLSLNPSPKSTPLPTFCATTHTLRPDLLADFPFTRAAKVASTRTRRSRQIHAVTNHKSKIIWCLCMNSLELSSTLERDVVKVQENT